MTIEYAPAVEMRAAVRDCLGNKCYGCDSTPTRGCRVRLDIHHSAHDGSEHKARLGIRSLLTDDFSGLKEANYRVVEYYCDIFLDVRRNPLHGYVLLCRGCHRRHHETFGYG